MRSRLPKVLHELAGRPLLSHVLDLASAFSRRPVVVVGQGADEVRRRFADTAIHWVLQPRQLGTGHALLQALPHLNPQHRTLVLYGDVPLLTSTSVAELSALTTPVAILTAVTVDPAGYGRCVRDAQGHLRAVVEERDASAEEQAICEVNSGVLVADTPHLARWLPALRPHNTQGELYLTDVIALAVAEKSHVATTEAAAWEIAGINTPQQLSLAERQFQRHNAHALLQQGVQLLDPERIDVRGQLRCGQDVIIDVGCVFKGAVELADGVRIGPYCVLENCRVGAGSVLLPYVVMDGVEVGGGCQIGPYARLRPGTVVDADSRVGNFVEVKNSRVGAGSKANHLSYLGDATIGKGVNIGAGTITCNYDGANKNHTTIGDGAFIGSGSQLVAPVTVGENATLGAGTVLVKNAPPDALTLTRRQQQCFTEWKRPTKKKEK